MEKSVKYLKLIRYIVSVIIILNLLSCTRKISHNKDMGAKLLQAIIQKDTVELSALAGQLSPAQLSGSLVDNRTPLIVAVESQSFESIPILLDSGADPLVASQSMAFLSGAYHLPIEVASRYAYSEAVIYFATHKTAVLYTLKTKKDIKKELINNEVDPQDAASLLEKLQKIGFLD